MEIDQPLAGSNPVDLAKLEQEDSQLADNDCQQQPVAAFGALVERKPGDKTHFCICCAFPVAVFGRLYPCLHAYCLACASDMSTCFICHAGITRIERYNRENGIFISPATMQSFKNEDEIVNHTRKVHAHLMAMAQRKETAKPKQPAPSTPGSDSSKTQGGGATVKSEPGAQQPVKGVSPQPPQQTPMPQGQMTVAQIKQEQGANMSQTGPQPPSQPPPQPSQQQQMMLQQQAQQQQMMLMARQQQQQQAAQQQAMQAQMQAQQLAMAQQGNMQGNMQGGGMQGMVNQGGMGMPGIVGNMNPQGMANQGMMGQGPNPMAGSMQGNMQGGMQGNMAPNQMQQMNMQQRQMPQMGMNPQMGMF